MEASLRESEEVFRAIFEKAHDGILLADAETKKFCFGNDMICRMLGYDKEELKRSASWTYIRKKIYLMLWKSSK